MSWMKVNRMRNANEHSKPKRNQLAAMKLQDWSLLSRTKDAAHPEHGSCKQWPFRKPGTTRCDNPRGNASDSSLPMFNDTQRFASPSLSRFSKLSNLEKSTACHCYLTILTILVSFHVSVDTCLLIANRCTTQKFTLDLSSLVMVKSYTNEAEPIHAPTLTCLYRRLSLEIWRFCFASFRRFSSDCKHL